MKVLVTDQTAEISQWVAEQSGVKAWKLGREQAIGLKDEAGWLAGALYDQWNRRSIGIHLAVRPGSLPTREFIRTLFVYPFIQLQAEKLLAYTGEGNLPIRKLAEHAGFTLEATLKAAHPMGDLLIYSMVRGQCRWLLTDTKELLCRHPIPLNKQIR